MAEHTDTLYQAATVEIELCIEAYLTLMKATKSLSDVKPEAIVDDRTRTILLAGLGASTGVGSADEACEEWRRRQAIAFDTETAITAGVYRNIRAIGPRSPGRAG